MPSMQSTQPDQSPKLSATEQQVHDAMSAAEFDTRTSPGPPNGELFNFQKASQEMIDNLNRKTRLGGKAAADYESERRETDVDSRRRYNSGVAAFCGLLGAAILPILIGREWFLDDRWLGILCIVGLTGGWALGAAYIYPLFYYENGTPRPHTARIHAAIGSQGRAFRTH